MACFSKTFFGFEAFFFRTAVFLLSFLGLPHVKTEASDIAVFYALDSDYKAFASKILPSRTPIKVDGHIIFSFVVGTHRIYMTKMGSGAVETAISASILLTRFHCSMAFSVGPVGALGNRLKLGSWYRIGSIIGYQHGSWSKDGIQTKPTLLQSGHEKTLFSSLLGGEPAILSNCEPVTVASGELFVASSVYRSQLAASTGADVVDMNLFGLETVCDSFAVPVYSWRIVSDAADDDASDVFRKFLDRYKGDGGLAIADLIQNLPLDPTEPETYPALREKMEHVGR